MCVFDSNPTRKTRKAEIRSCNSNATVHLRMYYSGHTGSSAPPFIFCSQFTCTVQGEFKTEGHFFSGLRPWDDEVVILSGGL